MKVRQLKPKDAEAYLSLRLEALQESYLRLHRVMRKKKSNRLKRIKQALRTKQSLSLSGLSKAHSLSGWSH